MSKCISMHGEYSDCVLDQNFICKRCTALDEDALFAKVEHLSAENARMQALLDLANREIQRLVPTLQRLRADLLAQDAERLRLAQMVERVMALIRAGSWNPVSARADIRAALEGKP